MLKIIYGELKSRDFVYNTDSYFDRFREDSWVTDPLSIEMIKDIDKSEVLGNHLIQSPVLGLIPPHYLSGGVKTLILINKMSNKIFNANACGDNCSKWLLEIGKRKDVVISLNYPMDFGKDGFEIEVLNTGKIVTNRFDLGLESVRDFNKSVTYMNGFFDYER